VCEKHINHLLLQGQHCFNGDIFSRFCGDLNLPDVFFREESLGYDIKGPSSSCKCAQGHSQDHLAPAQGQI